ncbi:DNA polymerase III subunit delta [Taibaiella sp. KBW10]|uniref:DNA polymerase III subunit delta n=1 Tax=Taibaiella sp. KBW10 TaxID=2153357 RepID=UPI000F59671E|nr:DNA polymerase III subunit delta [Taibaiella sp. KBW10]RQO30096.1 DNA polymerase III subunit delta [Taibaiella sp. KBW10]
MAKATKEKIDTLGEFNRLMAVLKSKQFKNVYLLEGDEPYYIDLLLDYFDHQILDADQKDFNLITLYGKDSEWSDVVNACSRFPMFADHTIVILREAAQLRQMDLMIPYLENPSATSMLVIDYRGKDTNSKDKWLKPIKEKGIVFKSHRLTEEDIPGWIQQYAAMQQFKVETEQAEVLAGYLGNDLQKITNELQKVQINEPNLSVLSPEMVERYIGISREYNYMEFPKVIFSNDKVRMSRMLTYFVANPKSAPLPALMATFYTFADRIYRCYSVPDDYNNPESRSLYYYRAYAKQFQLTTVHKFIALLNEFALKTVGINIANKSDSELLKELVGKLNALLHPQG